MPGLLTLKTDLKSLKYGQDRLGGGSSGQPYITTDISDIDSVINQIRTRVGDDGLIRGGIIGSTYSATTDTIRIGKFFKDIPRGPLFIAKQVGLQLSNPKLEYKKLGTNRPTSGGGFLNNLGNLIINTANTIENAVGSTRIYNLGVNTLAQIPVNAVGGHIVRHGFLPIADPSKYYANVVYENNFLNGTNRLTELTTKFKLGDRESNKIINSPLVSRINNISNAINSILGISIPTINVSNPDHIISEYIGGPNSSYGIGKTVIRRYYNTEDGFKINLAKENSKIFAGKTRDEKGNVKEVDLNRGLGLGNNSITEYPDVLDIINNTDLNLIPTSNNPSFKTYKNLSDKIKQQQSLKNSSNKSGSLWYNQFGIYNVIGSNTNGSSNGNYSSEDIGKIGYKNSYGDVVVVNKSNWAAASREVRVGSGRTDSINLTPLFNGDSGQDSLVVKIDGETHTINDLVKFRIEAINTDKPEKSTFMVFRAYITTFDDNVSAKWGTIDYIGRGEEFGIYNGFSRKINIGFKVAALSANEMKPMYQKLNYLMSNLMPERSIYENDCRKLD